MGGLTTSVYQDGGLNTSVYQDGGLTECGGLTQDGVFIKMVV